MHAHAYTTFTEKARKPAALVRSLARSRDGLSDLHARQVQRASRCITCLIHVSRIPGVTIPADFHNATRAPHRAPQRRAVLCRREDPPRIGGIFRRTRQIARSLRAPIDRVKRVSPTRGMVEATRLYIPSNPLTSRINSLCSQAEVKLDMCRVDYYGTYFFDGK